MSVNDVVRGIVEDELLKIDDARVALALLALTEWLDARAGLCAYVPGDGKKDARLIRFKKATKALAMELRDVR